MTEQAVRAGWGEARAKIIVWLNDFFDGNKHLPTWTEALAGTAVSAPTLAPTWKTWKAGKMKEMEQTHVVEEPSVVPVPVPSVISNAWSVAVSEFNAAAVQEIEANRISTRRVIDSLTEQNREKDEIIDNLSASFDEVQEAREMDQSVTAAVIEEKDKAIETLKLDLEKSRQELAGVNSKAESLQAQLQKSDDLVLELKGQLSTSTAEKLEVAKEAAAANQEVKDVGERVAELIKQSDIHVESFRKAEAIAEKLRQEKEELTQELAKTRIELSGANVKASERQDQLEKAEARGDKERERGDRAVEAARQRIADLERELSEVKRTSETK